MDAKIKKKKLIVLIEAINELPEGLMAIADDVDEIDQTVEFELNNYFKSIPLSKARVANVKEKYYYEFWKFHGRKQELMNVNSIVD